MSAMRAFWLKHKKNIFRVAIVWMFVAGTIWLAYEFWRLLFQPEPQGAFDLKIFQKWVSEWFTGDRLKTIYPPATFTILFPLLGWLEFTPARWLWAVSTLVALGTLIYLTLRASGAETQLERAFIALIPFSMYATGAIIGNGQLTVHVLAFLLTSLFLLGRAENSNRNNWLIAALFIFALVKPSVSAPFFWILLFVPGTLRPAIFAAVGYILLSACALLYQANDWVGLLRDTLRNSSFVAVRLGQINLHIWLASLGLGEFILPASLICLLALGLWIFWNRHIDLWILIGVTAIIARLWAYHAWYDDLLLLFPMIALFRIAKRDDSETRAWLAGILLALMLPAMIAPGGLYLFPAPWDLIYQIAQAVLWIAILIFLLGHANNARQRI